MSAISKLNSKNREENALDENGNEIFDNNTSKSNFNLENKLLDFFIVAICSILFSFISLLESSSDKIFIHFVLYVLIVIYILYLISIFTKNKKISLMRDVFIIFLIIMIIYVVIDIKKLNSNYDVVQKNNIEEESKIVE